MPEQRTIELPTAPPEMTNPFAREERERGGEGEGTVNPLERRLDTLENQMRQLRQSGRAARTETHIEQKVKFDTSNLKRKVDTMKISAVNFMRTLDANLDNENLTDEGFREFVRNSISLIDLDGGDQIIPRSRFEKIRDNQRKKHG